MQSTAGTENAFRELVGSHTDTHTFWGSALNSSRKLYITSTLLLGMRVNDRNDVL